MATERLTPDATSVVMRRGIVRRSRQAVPLAIAMLAIFAASAAAHTVTATATCGSVTFNWAVFSASGSGNGGLNTPTWEIVFKPAVGAPLVIQGEASFPGSTSSLTVPIPNGDGVATASSSWTPAETRDGNSNSGSTSLTIANCPASAPATTAAPAPVTVVTEVIGAAHPVATAAAPGILALSTNGSAAPTSAGAIRDTAVLSGGSSPTGAITFSLYSASDTTCSSLLRKVSVVVRGDGSYVSPAVAPESGGTYQWVASYSGDKNNQSLSGACNDPTERSTIAYTACVRSPVVLRGVPQIVTNSLFAYVAAPGVKSVTFYLDGHKLETLTRPSDRRFSIAVNARTLSYGAHRLKVKVTMDRSSCANETAGTFIHVKPASLQPTFAG
ncbi:MAG TPA: hypothetical protein VHM72_06330 [Solirubrobacteraceae bacterium]|nr:hypothetical protein [Solirubrobacteraceae bacterium]